MLLYEMFAIGIAVVLVVAAIGGLAALVMMGPEETALLRLARAAPAQRRLVAAAAQQERDARAAAAQRRRVAAAAQQDDWIRPLAQAPIRRCTRGAALTASRHTHHSTRNTGRERLKRIEDHLCRGETTRPSVSAVLPIPTANLLRRFYSDVPEIDVTCRPFRALSRVCSLIDIKQLVRKK